MAFGWPKILVAACSSFAKLKASDDPPGNERCVADRVPHLVVKGLVVIHRASRWLTVRKLALAIIVFATVVTVYSLANGWYRSRLVAQELARLHDAGVPTTAQELNAYVAIPVGEPNATAAWMKPIMMIENRAIGRHPYGFDVLDMYGHFPPPPGEDWPDLERAEAYIAKHNSLFDAIDKAVAMPGRCCFVPDYSDGAEILLPHVQWSRLITKLLTLRAYVRAHRGDHEGTLRDIYAMLLTASIHVDEPIEVTQLSYNSRLRRFALALERLLPVCDRNSPMLSTIQSELARVDTRRGMALSAIGDRVMGLTTFADPSTAGAKRVPSVVYRAWVDDDALSLLLTMREVDARIAGDWPVPLMLADRFAGVNWESSRVSSPLGQADWYAPTKFAEGLGANTTYFAIAQARANAAAAGIATARFQAVNDRWPDSLNALVPEFLTEVPVDPFTGEPLQFVRDDIEIRIYSVGPNRKDDGGQEVPEENEDGDRNYNGEPDVVFRIRTDGRD